MTDRNEGFYFVRRKYPKIESDKWEPAEYTVGLWHFLFDTNDYLDDDIAEVGESITKKIEPKFSDIITNDKCKHTKFAVKANVLRLLDAMIQDGSVNSVTNDSGYMVNLSVNCKECNLPFRFIGLQTGQSKTEPRVSIDSTELRAPIQSKLTPRKSIVTPWNK